MLIEFCAINYVMLNIFINGVDENFQEYTQTPSKPFTWIEFYNVCVGYNTKLENLNKYETFFQINKKWTSFKKVIKI